MGGPTLSGMTRRKYLPGLLVALLAVLWLPAPASAAVPWVPSPTDRWQWQLTGTVDTSVDAAVFDVDGFDTPAETVAALHARGKRVIAYFSVGSWENWRPDASRFPAAVKGRSNGWAGEKWLDVRRSDVLLPIMAARFDLAKAKGFDGVEPDNVDGYTNATGFPLAGAQQAAYNRAVAGLAHDRGLAVALKNDIDQAKALEPSFDFAVNEQCSQYGECGALAPFVQAGKAVLHCEYRARWARPVAGHKVVLKSLDLDAPVTFVN